MKIRPRIAFIDVETTGTDTTRHELLEIGCLVVSPDLQTITRTLSVRVIPTRLYDADPEALAIAGYDEDVWDAEGVELDEALAMLASALHDDDSPPPMLAGHNIGVFDERVLRAAHASCGRSWPAHPYRMLDTISLAWPLYSRGAVESLGLDSVCAHLGIDRGEAHRALPDARAALEVARALMGRYQEAA